MTEDTAMGSRSSCDRIIARDVVLQSTSLPRERGVRLLSDVVRLTGAAGAAYGWSDGLGPHVMVPVHLVRARSDVRWDAREPRTHVAALHERDGRSWQLMIRDARAAAVERSRPALARALAWFSGPHPRKAQPLPKAGDGRYARIVDGLAAYCDIGFELGRRDEIPTLRELFVDELGGLPAQAKTSVRALGEALDAPHDLIAIMSTLGDSAAVDGDHGAAVTLRLLAYECAARHGFARVATDVARALAKSFRTTTDFAASLRWYRIAGRIADFLEDDALAAVILDGEGNTHRHRGAYPAARACYERAWTLARASADPTALGSVAHSMMTVEREAGRLDSAARYAWIGLQVRTEPEDRANLLLNVGTLLRESGDWSSAADAFRVARETSRDPDVRMMAADALALCAALRGTDDYARWRSVARAESRSASPYLRAQVGYFRGASLRAMGRGRDAARVLAAVERYARGAGLHEWEVRAAELADAPPAPTRAEPGVAPVELRRELRAWRAAVTGEPQPVA